MAVETGAASWAAELARSGEVRVPPRRRVAARRTVIFGLLLANQVGVVVSAALGRQSWLWWPLFCVVSAPVFIAVTWTYARMSFSGQPVLAVDKSGVSLGRKHLAWNDVKTIEASRDWFGFVTVVPVTQRRKRQISVGKDHVRDLQGLAAWFEALRKEHQTAGRTA